MDYEARSSTKFVNMKSQRVKVEDSFASTFEDETETIQYLLAEPKSEYVTVDGVLSFGKENGGKGLNIEDFSFGYDCGLNTYNGGAHSAHPEGRYDELQFGDLDGLLDEVDNVEDIDAFDGLASPCDDYLLDIGCAGKASELGFPPCEGSHLENSTSESQSPGLSGSSNNAIGISESSTAALQEFEGKNSSVDKAVTHEFHGEFRQKRRRTSVVYSTAIHLRNHNELDNDENSFLSQIVSAKNEKVSVEATKRGAFLKDKRLRKPTQRYIEEFSGKKSKDFKRRENFSAVHAMRPRRLSSVPEEDFISENPTLAELRARIRRSQKHASIWELYSDSDSEESTTSDSEDYQPVTSDSEDNYMPSKRFSKQDRRKTQRLWTHEEVTKLVDGICEYGVGRWTDIKRILFPSSDHRTPLDLRDKWRNLLKNSCGKMLKEEVERKEMHGCPLPKSLASRVRELATVQPYPRQRGKKFAPPILPPASECASSNAIIKYVRRKNRS